MLEEINPSSGFGWNQVDFCGIYFFISAKDKTCEILVGYNLNAKFLDNKSLNHSVSYKFGLYENESSNLLKNFFKAKR